MSSHDWLHERGGLLTATERALGLPAVAPHPALVPPVYRVLQMPVMMTAVERALTLPAVAPHPALWPLFCPVLQMLAVRPSLACALSCAW